MCTPLPVRGPQAAWVLSHELGFLSASGIHEGIIVLSIHVRPTDAQHDTVGKYSGGFPRDHSPKPCSEIHLRKAHLQFTYAA